ncbi:MAG: DUF3515 family protein [Micrococcales bacterium]|nr:DUF3515 family protein [Micrococcales bacterium]
MSRRSLAAVAAVLLSVVLAGCASPVATKPAVKANDPRCAAVTVRLPSELGELAQRETNAQATGAWGDPMQVLLTCGVKVPARSTLPCVTVDGIDWIRDDSAAPTSVYTSFGRTPAVDVALQSARVSALTALSALSDAVSQTTKNGFRCQAPDDSGASPSPAPSSTPTP